LLARLGTTCVLAAHALCSAQASSDAGIAQTCDAWRSTRDTTFLVSWTTAFDKAAALEQAVSATQKLRGDVAGLRLTNRIAGTATVAIQNLDITAKLIGNL